MNFLQFLAVTFACLVAQIAVAQDPITERVQFRSGASGATINGALTGYESIHYILGAGEGQRMVVDMSASNASTYFNVYAPGDVPGEAEAMFIGPVSGLRYDAALPSSGDYLIQVFLNRNAARRDEATSYTLNITIGDSATPPDYADGLSGGPDYWAVTGVSTSLNVRSAPSTNASVVVGLARGTVVQNLGCRMNEGRRWCQVRQAGGGVTGWAAGQYLSESGPPTNVAAPASAPVYRVFEVPAGDILNVRSGPGAGNRVVGALGNGDTVRRLGCQNVGVSVWCEIEMMTDMRERGWVNDRFLQ